MATRRLLLLFFSFTLLSVYNAPALATDRLQEINSILEANGYRDVPEDCLRAVLAEEKSESRKFDSGSIVWSATKFMRAKGGKLERQRCFTCRMEVLTPEGYRRIDLMREGDEVLSWDDGKLVRNRVRAVHRAESVAFGELIDHLTGDEKPFEVTPDHPFYVPRLRTYYPLSDIAPEESLLHVRGDESGCASELRPAGYFVFRGTDHVYTLTLEGKPDNFIVNGIVVKNKPWPLV